MAFARLAEAYDAGFYAERLDSYDARDVQELFRVEKWSGFLKLVESVLRLSGGQFLETLLSDPAEMPVLSWRDKAGHKVDFVLPRPRGGVARCELWLNRSTRPRRGLG